MHTRRYALFQDRDFHGRLRKDKTHNNDAHVWGTFTCEIGLLSRAYPWPNKILIPSSKRSIGSHPEKNWRLSSVWLTPYKRPELWTRPRLSSNARRYGASGTLWRRYRSTTLRMDSPIATMTASSMVNRDFRRYWCLVCLLCTQ